ncbi:Sfi1-domain-containing protein [Decorospora gaudefroyi]|uniref:Sfi1-domain-containing protein n=1 Tax=Decorospora gaudefroyi TaxID=184978 RepID=A0A6A5K9B4_9PLEO|nr:Sfi1-domain-containing protein [Decorospora gaudefroyi]
MLPSMTQNGYEATDLTRDDLPDEVIETLYDIVCRAQNSTEQSTRTLFKAYEDVLEKSNLVPSDDVVFHRFLLHMQEHRREGEDLVTRFQRVLKDSFGLNVELLFNEGGEGVQHATNPDATRNGAQASLGRYSRRGSFDSFFDGTADKVAGTDHGDLPVRTRGRVQQGAPDGYGSNRRASSDTEAHSYQQPQPHLPIRNRVNGIAPQRSISAQHQPTHKRSASASTHGSLQIRGGGETGRYRNRAGDHDADESDFTDHTTSPKPDRVRIPGINAPFPADFYQPPRQRQRQHQHQQYVPEPFRPSDTRLMDDAETFEEQRLHRVTRECIRIWRNRTQERMNMRDDMERAAVAFDRRILLKASLEQLRDSARLRLSGRETNRFFERLETRADKARNLFLLTKAFTHWAQCAEDEVQRTSVARRHILRTRFFNGWRDITAVNELKIQHFALGKFLAKWRNRTATIRQNSQFAVYRYEDQLIRRTWDIWYYEHRSKGATKWHNDRTARITLQKWSEIAEVMRERDVWATDRRNRIVLQRTFQTWRQRALVVQSQQPQAEDFQRRALLRLTLHTLKKQAQLQPLLRQFQAQSSGRLVRKVFQDWRRDAQLSHQARNVDRMRVLRNAYTAWNDRLRIKALEDRIKDRIIVECLYKWTLASRVSLFQRVHDRQLKQSTFLAWITRTNQRANCLDVAERRFAQFKRAQLLRTCLRKMEAITTERRREEFAVVAEYQQKLKQRIFNKLQEKLQHFQQLQQWSADAHFYVLSKHTLKTWSEATQHARRNRRRDTYSQVRRIVKTNLVRRVFEHWRDKANHIAVLTQRANDMLEIRTLQDTRGYLHQWHDRTLVLRQQDTQATNLNAFKLTTRYLSAWSERMHALQTLDSQAVVLRQESTEIAATSALKKMGWRLWNMRRQEDNARALYERNFEKHVRAMIRFWLERSNERRPASPTPVSRPRGRRDRDDGDFNDGRGDRDLLNDDNDGGQGERGLQPSGDETQRLESWTAFDENALGLNNDLDLDLSLSLTPDPHRHQQHPTFTPNPHAPAPRPPGSILRRPNTYPQPQPPSALRPAPAILEDDASDLGADATFWSGTPLPPQPPTSSKPTAGYLKTPSKRSIVRAKRGASPEKTRVLSPVRRPLRSMVENQGRLGTMSAPPVQSRGQVRGMERGMTSFEKRLAEGGFGASVAGVGAGAGGRSGGRTGRGRGSRVGFGDVSFMG